MNRSSNSINVFFAVLFTSILLGVSCSAHQKKTLKYWIEFKDKQIAQSDFHPGNPCFDTTISQLSPESLARRAVKFGTTDRSKLITINDAPVSSVYKSALLKHSIIICSESRWANSLSAILTKQQFSIVKRLPFVKSIHPVLQGFTTWVDQVLGTALPVIQSDTIGNTYCGYDSIIYHYGYSKELLYSVNAVPLHMMGFNGEGVRLGYLDCGFRWRSMASTSMQHVIGEYDVIYKDSNVANEAADPPSQDGHGSNVLSVATSYFPDSVIGPAYNADLLLAKTEDLRGETPAEEDYYAEGLEWMEALGVDIASSSLGYKYFDSGYVSYNYNDLNGKKAISSIAAAHAASLGVLVCTAMGNSGQQETPSLGAPADADSILSCGALQFNDTIASFSSNGPTVDKRLKPEICAPGLNLTTVTAENYLIFNFSGTSAATPVVSSCCALIKQAHPEASAQQIRSAVIASAKLLTAKPDSVYGFGKIDTYNAALKLGTIIGAKKLFRDDSIYTVCVPIAANNKIKNARVVYALNIGGNYNQSIPLTLVTDSLIYSATFPPLLKGTHVRYYIEATDGADTITLSPRNATDSVYSFYVGDSMPNPPFVVKNKISASQTSVYPNPSTGIVTIPSQPGQTAYQVFDNRGAIVSEGILLNSAAINRLDFTFLASGSYFIAVTANGILHRYPIIIEHHR